MNAQHLKETETFLRTDRRALRHLITAHEKERELILCEIHDGLSQDLLGALMLMESREHTAPQNGSASLEDLPECIAFLRKAV